MKYSEFTKYEDNLEVAKDHCGVFATCSTCMHLMWASLTDGCPADAEMNARCLRRRKEDG